MKKLQLLLGLALTFFMAGNVDAQNQCDASFYVDSSNCNQLLFYPNDSTTNYTSYAWDFGDGTTSNNATASHSYSSDGSYMVTLVVLNTDSTGNITCSDSVTSPVYINCGNGNNGGGNNTNSSCDASFSVDSSNCNQLVFYPNDSTASNTSYLWDFGDGATSNNAIASHTYSANGTYTVSLIVFNQDSSGLCSDTVYNTVYINCGNGNNGGGNNTNSSCDASFSVDSSNCNQLVFYPNDSTASNTSYLWDFGDGATSNNAIASHTYSANGTYTVSLIVFNQDSSGLCSDTVYNTVYINCGNGNGNCDASFYSYEDSTNMNTIYFQPNNANTNASYTWNFGDGNTSTDIYASHTYNTNGNYTVTLFIAVVDSLGNTVCSDSSEQQITIPNVATSIQENAINTVTTYPNPFNNIINIVVDAKTEQRIELTILSINGSIITNEIHSISNGTNTININTENISSGIYLLNVKNIENGTKSVHKMIKQ